MYCSELVDYTLFVFVSVKTQMLSLIITHVKLRELLAFVDYHSIFPPSQSHLSYPSYTRTSH